MIRVRATKKRMQFHSSALAEKVQLRRWLVEQLGGRPRVLDCFCAAGMLWERAYDKTPRYVGLDLLQFNDARRTIVCDSRRYLRHVDAKLDAFDLFDLDAFGSPMEHFAIICSRLKPQPGRRIGFALTDGNDPPARFGMTPEALLHYVGMSGHAHASVQFDYRLDITAMAMAKGFKIAGLRLVEAKRSERPGNNVHALLGHPRRGRQRLTPRYFGAAVNFSLG